jgi:hypothetical protein
VRNAMAPGNHISLIVAICISWALCTQILVKSLGQTNEKFLYAIDNAYRHIAISRNVTLRDMGSDALRLVVSLFITVMGIAAGYDLHDLN